MAGTIQSLFFTPSHTQFLPFGHRNPCIPTNPVLFTSSSITYLRSRSSICIPIRACGPSDEINSNGNIDGRALNLAGRFDWTKPLLNFAGNNFLPLALISGVALGFANPSVGCLADKYSLSKFSTFGIFIISGLTLRSGDLNSAAEAWPVGIFGLASILLFTPYFSRIIMQIHLQPQEFVTGLAIFCCMPTTLSSGVALTQLAGGNSALALAMTVISNLLGILIVPFSIARFVAAGVGVSVPTKQLFKNLALTLLVPLILGKEKFLSYFVVQQLFFSFL